MIAKHPGVKKLIKLALEEDAYKNDITTKSLRVRGKAKGACYAKEKFVLAGVDVAIEVFKTVNKKVRSKKIAKDGDIVSPGFTIFEVEGQASSLLCAERTALNFLQILSGTATEARRLKNALEGANTVPYGTRKTIPGMRLLQKYALKVGGVKPHRINLAESILVKDNHIRLIGMDEVVRRLKKLKGKTPIEVEVQSIEDIEKALEVADIIMLDNLSQDDIKRALEIIGRRAIVEVSGGVNTEIAFKLSKLGVQRVSCGYLTRNLKTPDISFEIEKL